jgi:phosphomannomutase
VHVDRVLPLVNREAIAKAKPKVVVDSVHGAGGPAAAMLLRELGVELVHMYGEPTGLFPHTPEPTRENLTELAAAVKQHKAACGFAQDPDADRLAIVDEMGSYIGEEYTLALCALHALAAGRVPSPVLVANLSTSRMIDDIAAKHGGSVVRTAVGEANVAAAMTKRRALIGGEGNGGIIDPRVTLVRDSVAGIAFILDLLAARKQPLSSIVKSIPAYAIVKDKIAFDAGIAARLVPTLKAAFSKQAIDLQDGVRIDWPDRWVHMRASNTEPIMRIIAEAPKNEDAVALIAEVKRAMGI